MISRALSVALAAGGFCASTQAAVFFTFDDPGPGAEITYTEGAGFNAGVVSYTGAPVDLIVDGTEHGLGTIAYTATVTMEIFIGQVADETLGILSAPILGGSFQFHDSAGEGDTLILEGSFLGELNNGALLTLNTVGALISTSTGAGLVLSEGAALASFLGGLTLAPTFDISFTLTNIIAGTEGGMKNPDGYITSFTANSAFTGNANVVPTPGAIALSGISMSLLAVRRKRA